MFIFEVPGGEISAADTQQRITAIESTHVDSALEIPQLEAALVDSLLVLSLLDASLADTTLTISHSEATLVDTLLVLSLLDASLADTHLGVTSVEVSLVDTRLVNPAVSFVHALGRVQFPWPPQRPQQRTVNRAQLRELDSAADAYVYGKSLTDRAALQLVFPRVDTATLQSLLTWVRATVRGTAETFIWIDHNKVQHNARLRTPRIKHLQTGPNRHLVEIALEEDLS